MCCGAVCSAVGRAGLYDSAIDVRYGIHIFVFVFDSGERAKGPDYRSGNGEQLVRRTFWSFRKVRFAMKIHLCMPIVRSIFSDSDQAHL